MEIQLSSEDRIRLTAAGPGVAFQATDGAELSPFHLLAASLATCTYAVLQSYGEHARIPLDGLAIEVGWELGGEPFRVTRMDMEVDWVGLPPERRDAARRAAAQCTVHHTLQHGSPVETRVSKRHAEEPRS